MAEIPIEKKGGGVPWWVWLLGLIALGLLLWAIFGRGDRATTPATTTTATTATTTTEDTTLATAQAVGPPITDWADLRRTDTAQLIGRRVELMGVPIQTAVPTGGVYVGTGPNDRVFVSTLSPSGFAAGQRVNVVGTVHDSSMATWGASGPPQALPSDANYYIEAESIQPA